MKNFFKKKEDWDKELSELNALLSSDGDTVVDINQLEEFLKKFSEEETAFDKNAVEKRIIKLLLDVEVYYIQSQSNSEIIRELFSKYPHVIRYLESFPSIISEKIQSSKDAELITAGLLAASIQNLALDPRDFLLSLDELITKLIEKHIDFNKILERIANVSSGIERGSFGSARSNLLKYTKQQS